MRNFVQTWIRIDMMRNFWQKFNFVLKQDTVTQENLPYTNGLTELADYLFRKPMGTLRVT